MGLKTHKNRVAIHFSNGAKLLNIGNSTEWSLIRSLIIHCPVSAEIKAVDSQSDLRMLL